MVRREGQMCDGTGDGTQQTPASACCCGTALLCLLRDALRYTTVLSAEPDATISALSHVRTHLGGPAPCIIGSALVCAATSEPFLLTPDMLNERYGIDASPHEQEQPSACRE
jgi:hypothetical protein